MATHAELVNELPLLERMSTSERMRLAKKRRSQQLRKYAQLEQKREKELLQQQQQQNQEDDYFSNKLQTIEPAIQKTKAKKVSFVPSVMLLEAGNRNDVNEGSNDCNCNNISRIVSRIKVKVRIGVKNRVRLINAGFIKHCYLSMFMAYV